MNRMNEVMLYRLIDGEKQLAHHFRSDGLTSLRLEIFNNGELKQSLEAFLEEVKE